MTKCCTSVGCENVQDAVNDFGRKMDTSDYSNQENEADGPKRNKNEEANEHSEGEHSITGEDLLDITYNMLLMAK